MATKGRTSIRRIRVLDWNVSGYCHGDVCTETVWSTYVVRHEPVATYTLFLLVLPDPFVNSPTCASSSLSFFLIMFFPCFILFPWLLFSLSTVPVLSLIILVVSGTFWLLSLNPSNTANQLLATDANRGRVLSIMLLAQQGGDPNKGKMMTPG